MAEESTTGSALYSVGTGVIGDFSAEARKNAMDRMKVQGIEQKRKQQETEKISEDAYARLNELKTDGSRFYNEYLQEKRDGVSNWLADGFEKTDGKLFSGSDGRKKRTEFNNMIADYNRTASYTTQVTNDIEKQQALLAQAPESYTQESIDANANYMSLNVEDQIYTPVPKLELKVDPVDWYKNLVTDLPKDMFTERDPHSSGSNSYILNEEKLNAHLDNVMQASFLEGAGTDATGGFVGQMKILFDDGDKTKAIARGLDRYTTIDEETGDTAYTKALKDFSREHLFEAIKLTQSSGKISAADPITPTKEPEAAPVKSGGGTQAFLNGYYTPSLFPDITYTSSANIDFNDKGKSLRAINAEFVILESGLFERRRTNTILPKDGGFVEYGMKFEDFPEDMQKELKKVGITGPTVDMLRITETTKKVDDGYGNVSGGEGKSTLIPITPQLRTSLKGASVKFKALEEASAGELD